MHHLVLYYGPIYQWVDIFKQNGMSMFWGEDYIFSVPEAPQIFSWMMSQVRCGVKYNQQPIHFYIMPHSPGNTPNAWRRQFHTALAHGAKVFNLFEFRPVQFAYTENYVNSPDMYQAVRVAMHELGKYEDILQDGHVRPAQAALWMERLGASILVSQPGYAEGLLRGAPPATLSTLRSASSALAPMRTRSAAIATCVNTSSSTAAGCGPDWSPSRTKSSGPRTGRASIGLVPLMSPMNGLTMTVDAFENRGTLHYPLSNDDVM